MIEKRLKFLDFLFGKIYSYFGSVSIKLNKLMDAKRFIDKAFDYMSDLPNKHSYPIY